MTVSNFVHQVTLLPSYNRKVTVSLLCSLPILIYPNLFEFILNLLMELIEFFSEKRDHVTKLVSSESAAIIPHLVLHT